MLGERYIVKKGDNLWHIAAAMLGRGKEWPRIWRYNNRPDVVRVTGRRISDPDRIYVGQLLLIPRLTTLPVARDPVDAAPSGLQPAMDPSAPAPQARLRPESPPRTSNESPLGDQLRHLKFPLMFRFRLGEYSWPPQDIGTAVIQVKLSGEVLLKSKDSYPATLVVSTEDLEAQISRDANYAFGKLISEQKFAYEPASKKVTVSSMLITQSNVPNTVATAVGVEMASDSPIPKFKAEIKLPTLQGSISGFEYVAIDASVSLEITPRPPQTPDGRLRTETQKLVNPWTVAVGAAVVVAAAAVFIANGVEDVFTGGLGLADDPLVFAATGAALARGLAMMGVAATAGLPKSSTPARVRVTASFTSKGPLL
jgi:hypothetical protein